MMPPAPASRSRPHRSQPRHSRPVTRLLFTARHLLTLLAGVAAVCLPQASLGGQGRETVFACGFESKADCLTLVYGASLAPGEGRDGGTAIRADEGEASLRSQTRVAEAGDLDLWIRTSGPQTRYALTVLAGESQNKDSGWVPVARFSGSNEGSEYRARRLSVDDAGEKFLRIDIETEGGTLLIDDVSIQRILLDKALGRQQEKILGNVMEKLRDDRSYQVQADELRALGKTYIDQIDAQRQYLAYANGLFASVTLAQATAERGRMANPLGYQSFEDIVHDTRRVATPLQKARMDSLLRLLGDVGTGALNVMTHGLFGAFAEPFKTIVATAFDKASYSSADLDRKARKFAEEYGLEVFSETDTFLDQIERELVTSNKLDGDLVDLRKRLDKFRKDLEAHLTQSMIAGGLGRGQQNFDRITSKDSEVRQAALDEIGRFFQTQADSYRNRSSSDARFVQFMMTASSHIEQTRRFKERFNDIAASMLTFYDSFERSVAASQNPFRDETDRAVWEAKAASVRSSLAESRAAFMKAYL
jgi:hypothetical protein